MVFFKALLVIQDMDIFQGGELFSLIDFQETEPYNEHFEQFGIENLNFFINSGSFMIIQVMIPFYILLEIMINKLALFCRKYKFCRKIGISFFNPRPIRSLWQGFLKFFMESYFDVVICAVLSVHGLINAESKGKNFFDHPQDIVCSSFTIFYSLAAICFPVWGVVILSRNFKKLGLPGFQGKYYFLYSDVKVNSIR